ncbi:Cof-type HAD-IIB family hydrolase [Cohnella thermotolerans]|uniref:Cof-type HAD-IIB family hydrolase n=1 Tax=Cohnella thermotolerans TaxID=329858 RepID=UPI000410EAC9|nr:Cof-type HAD-IIB family hydrolase [Cohnella thermotolerans]
MTYRLIALDIDGTLINDDHELTPRVRTAVRTAAERGAEIVLCTGRGSSGALPVIEELGLAGTMITHNGASIVDSSTRRVLYETAIAPEAAGRYMAYCRERGIHFDMNTAFELYVERLSEETARMYERMFARPIEWKAELGLPERTVKLSVFAAKEVLDEVQAEWEAWDTGLQIVRSGDFFIDVQPLDASKGRALEQLARLRGIPRQEVLAIGNYYNDIGMIEYAGYGVAMGNAPEAVKSVSDAVTVSNNDDGVALVLEELLGA